MNEREGYSLMLKMACDFKSTSIIDNDTFEDSADVMERIFLESTNEVYIFARGIKDRIFNTTRVVEATTEFLGRQGATLKFVLRAKNEDDAVKTLSSEFIAKVRNEANLGENASFEIDFYKGSNDWQKSIPSSAIGDNRMYRKRLKLDCIEDYGTNAKAHVCFNDENECANIKDAINSGLKEEKAMLSRKIL